MEPCYGERGFFTQQATGQSDFLPLDKTPHLRSHRPCTLVTVYVYISGTHGEIFLFWVSAHFGSALSQQSSCEAVYSYLTFKNEVLLCQKFRILAVNTVFRWLLLGLFCGCLHDKVLHKAIKTCCHFVLTEPSCYKLLSLKCFETLFECLHM